MLSVRPPTSTCKVREGDVEPVFRHKFIGKENTEKLAELACKSLGQLVLDDREDRNLYYMARHIVGCWSPHMIPCLMVRNSLPTRYTGVLELTCVRWSAKAVYEVEVELAVWDPSESRGFLSFTNTTQVFYASVVAGFGVERTAQRASSGSGRSCCHSVQVSTWSET